MGLEAAAIVAIASTAVSAGTAIYQGQQQKKAANMQADQAEAEGEFQRKQAEADAKTEKDAAELRAMQIRKAGKEQRAKTRAAAAASGMDVGFGTAVDLTTSVDEAAESDAQMSIFGGLDAFKKGRQAGESYGIRGQNEGIALRNEGKAAAQAGYVSAIGSVASGGKDMYAARKGK